MKLKLTILPALVILLFQACSSRRDMSPDQKNAKPQAVTKDAQTSAAKDHYVGHSPLSDKPKFIVPIIIDQGAYHYFTRFADYFQHGFRRFLDAGLVYTNAHHPHAAPVTATGHAMLNVGCYPDKHGVIMNTWYAKDGKLTASVDDDRDAAAVHAAKGSCDCRASSRSIMVPGISDVVLASSTPECAYHVYSVSYKDRAALGMGAHTGKCIWFDEHQQAFTSNHDCFDKLPQWLLDFNKALPEKIDRARNWDLFFEPNHRIYADFAKNIYHHSTLPVSIAGERLSDFGDLKKLACDKNFMLAPLSSKILFDLALVCMDQAVKKNVEENRALIWISLSSLDKIGHIYGPHSKEAIDTIMHMDKLIGDFMHDAEAKFGKGNIMFMLCADHGSSPIPENLAEEDYQPAKRIIMHKVIKKLNADIEKKFGIEKLFFGFKTNQLYWDEAKIDKLSQGVRENLTQFVKRYLKSIPGMKSVWTYDELMNSEPREGSMKYLFKRQIYPGRSGHFFCLGQPFVMLSNFDKGTCHRTPYDHDTHVPLMILWPDKQKHHVERSRVLTAQVAPSIAKVWGLEPAKEMVHGPLPRLGE